MAKNITLTQAQLDTLVKNAVADALAQVSTTKSSKGRKAPTSTKSNNTTTKTPSKKVKFVKKNGEVLMVTPKQKANMERYRDRGSNRKTPEELQAITDAFKWTKALDNAIKANPGISTREIHELGGKGCTKQMLKARKVELGVR